MTRIRFIGSFASGKPLSPFGLPVVGSNINQQRTRARMFYRTFSFIACLTRFTYTDANVILVWIISDILKLKMARLDLQKLGAFVAPPEKKWFLGLLATSVGLGFISGLAHAHAMSEAMSHPAESNQWPLIDHGNTYYITDMQNTILSIVEPAWMIVQISFFFYALFILLPRISRRMKSANKSVKDIC
jgi:hypothetical protein